MQRQNHRKKEVEVSGGTPDQFLKVQCPSTQVLPKNPSRPRGMDDRVASKEEGSIQWWFVVALVFVYTTFVSIIAVLTTSKVKDWVSAVLSEKEEWKRFMYSLPRPQCTLPPAATNVVPNDTRRRTKVTGTRTVGVKSMCTYRRNLTNPRFEWITPQKLDKVDVQE